MCLECNISPFRKKVSSKTLLMMTIAWGFDWLSFLGDLVLLLHAHFLYYFRCKCIYNIHFISMCIPWETWPWHFQHNALQEHMSECCCLIQGIALSFSIKVYLVHSHHLRWTQPITLKHHSITERFPTNWQVVVFRSYLKALGASHLTVLLLLLP